MVGVLIEMKLRVLRHSIGGSRAAGMVLGGLAGLVLATGTVALAGLEYASPAVAEDLLAAVFAGWLFGWLLGPVYTGGGDESVRPEHFALLPVRPARLAVGLLGTAFVGIAPVVSLIAFGALAVYAADFGGAGLVIALVAIPLQLVMVVALSRLMIGTLGVVMRSRLGAILAALVNASMNVLLNQSWVLVWAAISGTCSGSDSRPASPPWCTGCPRAGAWRRWRRPGVGTGRWWRPRCWACAPSSCRRC